MICSIYNQQPKQNSSLLSYHDSEEGQVQVQLAFASLYLDLAFVDLSGVGGGPPRATPAEVVQVNLKDFNLTSTTSARVGEVHLRYCAICIKAFPKELSTLPSLHYSFQNTPSSSHQLLNLHKIDFKFPFQPQKLDCQNYC